MIEGEVSPMDRRSDHLWVQNHACGPHQCPANVPVVVDRCDRIQKPSSCSFLQTELVKET